METLAKTPYRCGSGGKRTVSAFSASAPEGNKFPLPSHWLSFLSFFLNQTLLPDSWTTGQRPRLGTAAVRHNLTSKTCQQSRKIEIMMITE